MHIRRILLLPTVAVGLALSLLTPRQLLAAHAGGTLKKVAEQLGLVIQALPLEVIPGGVYVFTVLNPDRLGKLGLTDLKANDKVALTVIDDKQVSVARVATPDPKGAVQAPANKLLVVTDEKGVIARTQVLGGDAQLPITVRPGPATRAQPQGTVPRALPERPAEVTPRDGAVTPPR
jgi:hypothetical protein